MHFITNGYKRFSKINSSDPRQRVSLRRQVYFRVIVKSLATPNHPIAVAEDANSVTAKSRCQMQLCPPCNTVRSGHFCICNRVRDMYTTVHVCASVHARNLRICSMIIHVFMIAATTQRPNMHLACKKIANVFRRPRAFSLQQGRF